MGNGDDDGVGLAKKLSTHQNIDTPFYGVLCFQESLFIFLLNLFLIINVYYRLYCYLFISFCCCVTKYKYIDSLVALPLRMDYMINLFIEEFWRSFFCSSNVKFGSHNFFVYCFDIIFNILPLLHIYIQLLLRVNKLSLS